MVKWRKRKQQQPLFSLVPELFSSCSGTVAGPLRFSALGSCESRVKFAATCPTRDVQSESQQTLQTGQPGYLVGLMRSVDLCRIKGPNLGASMLCAELHGRHARQPLRRPQRTKSLARPSFAGSSVCPASPSARPMNRLALKIVCWGYRPRRLCFSDVQGITSLPSSSQSAQHSRLTRLDSTLLYLRRQCCRPP